MWQPVGAVHGRRVSHYEVKRSTTPWTPLVDDVTGTIYLDMEGRPGEDYRVRAVNDRGVPGPWSTLTTADKVPGMPGDFAVELSNSGNAAVLSWTEPGSSSPIPGYVIDISDSPDGDSEWTEWKSVGTGPGRPACAHGDQP